MQEVFRPAVRWIVVNDKNEVLLVQHKKGNWAIPGGGLDFWENLLDWLKREFMEELGVDIKIGKMIFLQDFLFEKNWKKAHSLEYFFLIENYKDFEKIKETYQKSSHSFELKDVKFFSLENFPENFKPQNLKKVLQKYFENKQNFNCEYVSGI